MENAVGEVGEWGVWWGVEGGGGGGGGGGDSLKIIDMQRKHSSVTSIQWRPMPALLVMIVNKKYSLD